MTNVGREHCAVRRMEAKDIAAVLSWRNDPRVRRYMYTQALITESEHLAWFQRASADPKRHLLIVEEAGRPLGFVQFTAQEDGDTASWGFYAVPGSPRGTGRKLARAALDYAFGFLKIARVRGEALASNKASIGFHKALGFKEQMDIEPRTLQYPASSEIREFWISAEEWSTNRKD